MEDKQIIGLFFERSESAISEVQKKYSSYCFSIANNILHEKSESEECLNDTYLAAWNSIPPNNPENLAAFLGKLTRNISLKRFRNHTAKKRGGEETALILDEIDECFTVYDNVENQLMLSELVDILNDFLEELPLSERRVFIRRYWYFETVKDVAAFYGYSESKVKMILKRSRDKLRTTLSKEGYGI
ncbi:MAG: sigma-70 family RNA polymerase sigma factor [Bacillota bacterium]|nr:sigma-70 family RNA polymerase sigma factor [Bacillota bacterium]